MLQRVRTSLTTLAFVFLVVMAVLAWVRPDFVLGVLGLDALGARGAATVRAVYGSGMLYVAFLAGWVLLRPNAARVALRAAAGFVLVVGISRFVMDGVLGTWDATGVMLASLETFIGLVLVFVLPGAEADATGVSGPRSPRRRDAAPEGDESDENPLNAYRS